MKELCNADSEMDSISFLTKETVHFIVEVSTLNIESITDLIMVSWIARKLEILQLYCFKIPSWSSKYSYIHSMGIFWHFYVNTVIFFFFWGGSEKIPQKQM